jgi:hypothetical protein
MKAHLASVLGAAVLSLSFGVTATYGHVIDPDVNEDAAKLRKDVGKRGDKLTICLLKAATKCEEDGVSAAPECHLGTGVVDYDPGGPAETKFQEKIAKCNDKYDPAKKGTDYVGIGCPGDCAATSGVQQCADMSPAYETDAEGDAKGIPAILLQNIPDSCQLDGVGVDDSDPARIECVRQHTATLSAYTKGLLKCVQKCENDFKNKKGNGGGTNGPNCLAGVSTAQAFNDCEAEKLAKAVDKHGPLSANNTTQSLAIHRLLINNATNRFYNRADPTDADPTTSSLSPCGNCGNGIREGAEECDLSDDALCSSSCNSDCNCF